MDWYSDCKGISKQEVGLPKPQFVSRGREGGITAIPGTMQWSVQGDLAADIHQSRVARTRTQQQ